MFRRWGLWNFSLNLYNPYSVSLTIIDILPTDKSGGFLRKAKAGRMNYPQS